MPDIHPTAIVDGGAHIGANVTVGPYSIVGAGVELADGVTVMSHVVVDGCTSIGANTKVYPFASIGLAPRTSNTKASPRGSRSGATTSSASTSPCTGEPKAAAW